jgi:hypothetical protein
MFLYYAHKVTKELKDEYGSDIAILGEAAPMYEELNKHIIVVGTSGNVIGVNTMASFCEHSMLKKL